MIGSPMTNERPASEPLADRALLVLDRRFGRVIRRRKTTEPRYESASPSIASGAPNTWTRRPPMVGPATDASDRLPLSRAIAST